MSTLMLSAAVIYDFVVKHNRDKAKHFNWLVQIKYIYYSRIFISATFTEILQKVGRERWKSNNVYKR